MNTTSIEISRDGPKPADLRRWRQHLAAERAEAAVYRYLAGRRTGEEKAILLALAEAEGRHEEHWRALLGDQVGKPRSGGIRTRLLGFLARRFGSVFVLALAQRAEVRSPYDSDSDATPAMAGAVTNAVGKILSSISLEIKYQQAAGRTVNVPMLNAGKAA